MKTTLTTFLLLSCVYGNSQLSLNWGYSLGSISSIGVDGVNQSQSDAFGNVYVCGYFDEVMDIDPSDGVFEITSISGSDFDGFNGFIVKYNNSGELLWGAPIPSNTRSNCKGIIIGDDGHPILVGDFVEHVDLDPGVGEMNEAGNGSTDCFMIKIDKDNGQLLWGFTFGNANTDTSVGFARDSEGNVLVFGQFEGIVDFDGSDEQALLASEGTAQNYYMAKYNPDGNFMWAKNINNGGAYAFLYSRSVAFFANGDFVVTGFFIEEIDLDPDLKNSYILSVFEGDTDPDCFIARYSNNGEFIWGKSIGGTENDDGHAVAIDSDDNVYWSGRFGVEVDLDPGEGVQTAFENGALGDIFFIKLSASGDLIWANHIGCPLDDSAYAIDVTDNGNLILAGHYRGTMDVDAGSGVTLLNAGSESVHSYVAIYTTDGDFESAYDLRGTMAGSDPTINDMHVSGNNLYISGSFRFQIDVDFTEEDLFLDGYGSYDLFTCAYSSDIFIGLNDVTKDAHIVLYPNPASNEVSLQLFSTSSHTSQKIIHIFDVSGQLVQSNSFSNTFSVATLAAGAYIVEYNGIKALLVKD